MGGACEILRVKTDLDTLLTSLYVHLDDRILPPLGFSRDRHPGRKPTLNDIELLCLLVAQQLLGIASDRKWIRYARILLLDMFPDLPQQPGWGKRVRQSTGLLSPILTELARDTPSWADRTRLLDSTPVPCGKSRETVKRSDLAGHAGYGYCASHSRYFCGFRLYLPCAGQVIVADKGFAGTDFDTFITNDFGAELIRPDRKDEKPRFRKLGGIRQWVESVFDTMKGQLTLEEHGGPTIAGVYSRVAARPIALAAAIWHNWLIGEPTKRSLIASDQ